MSCDGDAQPSGCQQNIDSHLDGAREYLEKEASCCPASGKAKRDMSWMDWMDRARTLLGISRRATPVQCDYVPQPGQNPFQPPQGTCYATWTCPDDLYPNVCGNAKSAIMNRRATSILTHVQGSILHNNKHWSPGHYFSPEGENPGSGWKLRDCEVEEYPFGSGNPDRSMSGDTTLRLIPKSENGAHGRKLMQWVQAASRKYYEANNLQYNQARYWNGLKYCVAFRPSFTAYLPEDQVKDNICSQPYGPAFGLVNEQVRTDAMGRTFRSWDPWFDQGAGRKTFEFEHYVMPDGTISGDNVAGDAEYEVSAYLPPTYCYAPAPGRKQYVGDNLFAGHWELEDGYVPTPRDTSLSRFWDKCTDVTASLAIIKRDSLNMTAPVGEIPTRDHARDLLPRQSVAGFLDARVYTYFGCGETPDDGDGEDPCAADDALCAGSSIPSGHNLDPDADPLPAATQPGQSTIPASVQVTTQNSHGGSPGPTTTKPPAPVTSFISCDHQDQSPGLGISSGYCVCDKSTFSESLATQVVPHNSCGYTAKPTQTIAITTQMTVSTDTPHCQVCTLIGHQQECTSLASCTPEPTSQPEPEPEPTPSFTATNIRDEIKVARGGAFSGGFCTITATFRSPGGDSVDFNSGSDCTWSQDNAGHYQEQGGFKIRFSCYVFGGECGNQFDVEVQSDDGQCGKGTTKWKSCGGTKRDPQSDTESGNYTVCYEDLVLGPC